MVSENNDPAFRAVWVHVGILFDCDTAHCGDGARSARFTELLVLVLGDDFVDVMIEETLFLFRVAGEPDGAIGI